MTKVIFDTNIFLTMGRDYSFEEGKGAAELILGKEIDKIIVTSSVYSELEKIKKCSYTTKGNDAIYIFSQIGKALEKGELDYEELPYNEKGVDDSLIEYATSNNIPFLTLDVRARIRYNKRLDKEIKTSYNEEKFIKVLEIVRNLKTIDKGNLFEYLDRMFDCKYIDSVDLIQLKDSERMEKVIEFVVEEKLYNEEDFKDYIKAKALLLYGGEIDIITLKRNLKKSRSGNFKDLEIKESLRDKYRTIINKFLEEKGFSSFEELEKAQPFFTEEELIRGIKKYYYGEKDNGEKRL